MDEDDSTAGLRVFVYGTLKRGQCRERCWPHAPHCIERAFVLGQLYDFGEYPAIIPGTDQVMGELWCFEAKHAPATLAVLDEIEDYRGRADDLYHRVSINTHLIDREATMEAFTYVFARPEQLDASQRIPPNNQFCIWPPSDRGADRFEKPT